MQKCLASRFSTRLRDENPPVTFESKDRAHFYLPEKNHFPSWRKGVCSVTVKRRLPHALGEYRVRMLQSHRRELTRPSRVCIYTCSTPTQLELTIVVNDRSTISKPWEVIEA
jgi:hypothetical protein